MNQSLVLSAILFFYLNTYLWSQNKYFEISTVAFYNLENLFDTKDDPTTFDEAYTPNGSKLWDNKKLDLKLENLSKVISQIGKATTKQAPALLGVAEVENLEVLQQLVDHPNLSNINYGIVHFNSPDRRGIDVALLYDRLRFRVTNTQKHELFLKDHLGNRVYTRDLLCVSGYLGNNLLYCIVNHWPSRRGGTKKSEYKRIKAAKLAHRVIDSIYKLTTNANIIVMGDFNDDPTNKSLKEYIGCYNITKASKGSFLHNPMSKMKKKGLGTLAYRDKWNIFDQLLFSKSMLDSTGLQLYQTHIYNPKYLISSSGKYKGYPKRSTDNEVGYSDHFPVYSYLINECIDPN